MTQSILLELGGLLIALAFLAHFATRLSFSPVPLYLAAGLVFGEDGPLPLAGSLEFIEVAAEIGVVLLLFALGLEYSASELLSQLRITLPSGAVDFALNFTPGLIVGLVAGWGGVVAIMLGGITYISSSGIVARLISDMGWAKTPEASKTIGILVVEDLVMAGYLALVGVLIVGTGFVSAMVALGGAAVLVVAAIVLNLRFGDRISHWLFSHEGEKLLLGLIGLSLLAAGAAESIQVSAAVGAFLAGLAVSGRASHALSRQIDPLRDFFAAAFFVLFGFQVDFTALGDVMWLAVGLAVVTSLTKLGTGWYAGRRIGLGVVGRARIGTLLVSRGEFSIIIAELGVSAGLRRDLAVLAAAYVLITAALGPVLVRLTGALFEPAQPTAS